jgi:hypothetical protein
MSPHWGSENNFHGLTFFTSLSSGFASPSKLLSSHLAIPLTLILVVAKVFSFIRRVLLKVWSHSGFLHRTEIKYFDVSEKHTFRVFRIVGLFQVDAELANQSTNQLTNQPNQTQTKRI